MVSNIIHKKICLEDFRSRVPGLLSTVDDINNESVNKGNWGEIPYDLDLSKINGLENLKQYMKDWAYNLKGYDPVTKHPILPTEERLRFKSLMLWYYWIIDLCKKSEIYEWSVNNAIIDNTDGQWVLMDNFDIYDKNITNKTIVVYVNKNEFNEDDEISTINEEDKENWDIEKYYVVVSSKEDEEFFYNHSGFEIINLVESITGRLYIPTYITGEDVPKFIYYSEIQDTLNSMEIAKNTNNCCLLDKYEKMGGDNMFMFLDKNVNRYEEEYEKFKIHKLEPYVNIPIAIISEIDDLGVMYDSIQEWVEGFKYDKGDIVSYNGSTYISTINNNTGVYSDEYEEVYFDMLDKDDNIILTNWDEYLNTEDLLNNSNENKLIEAEATSQLSKFRTKRKCFNDEGQELEGAIPYFVIGNKINIIFDDEGYVVLDLPFMKNVPINVRSDEENTYADVLYDIIEEDNIVRFKYVLGGRLNRNGGYSYNTDGIHYEEAYIFSWEITLENIDGVCRRVKYRLVNYGLNVDNGSTNPILSKVTYKSNNVWNYENAISAPLFRKDSLIGFMEKPKEDIDISIDRGLSHAFEKHLMLCETNTFNDLQNYKNNYFNLQ
jgi:hypothetical protein